MKDTRFGKDQDASEAGKRGYEKAKDKLDHENDGRLGGNVCLRKHGREHYVKMAQKSAESRRKRANES